MADIVTGIIRDMHKSKSQDIYNRAMRRSVKTGLIAGALIEVERGRFIQEPSIEYISNSLTSLVWSGFNRARR